MRKQKLILIPFILFFNYILLTIARETANYTVYTSYVVFSGIVIFLLLSTYFGKENYILQRVIQLLSVMVFVLYLFLGDRMMQEIKFDHIEYRTLLNQSGGYTTTMWMDVEYQILEQTFYAHSEIGPEHRATSDDVVLGDLHIGFFPPPIGTYMLLIGIPYNVTILADVILTVKKDKVVKRKKLQYNAYDF